MKFNHLRSFCFSSDIGSTSVENLRLNQYFSHRKPLVNPFDGDDKNISGLNRWNGGLDGADFIGDGLYGLEATVRIETLLNQSR